MKKTKVISAILLAIMIPIAMFSASAFAWTTYPDTPTYPTDYSTKPYQVIQELNGTIYLFVGDTPFFVSDGYVHNLSFWTVLYLNGTGTDWNIASNKNAGGTFVAGTILQANEDVYTNSSYDTVFFSPASPLILASRNISPQTILSPILGLMPLVLGLLIISLAFWKSWRFLSTALRGA